MPIALNYQLAVEPLVADNVIKLVKDNFKPTIDALYPVEAALPSSDARFLPDFASRTLGDFMRMGFPVFVADLADGKDEESDGGYINDESISIDMLIVVTDPDGSNVSRRLFKYVRALRVLLMSATWQHYFEGVPATQQTALTISLTRKFRASGKGKGEFAGYGYMRPAEFTLKLAFNER